MAKLKDEVEQFRGMEYFEEIIFNHFMDARKKEINRFARAKLLRVYMDKERLSEPELAKRFGVPKSTIYDWMLFDKITEDQYEKLKSKGIKDTQIYRVLHDNTPIKELNHIEEVTKLDAILEEWIREIKYYISGVNKEMISSMTDDLCHELVSQLNRLRMEIERVRKR